MKVAGSVRGVWCVRMFSKVEAWNLEAPSTLKLEAQIVSTEPYDCSGIIMFLQISGIRL